MSNAYSPFNTELKGSKDLKATEKQFPGKLVIAWG